MMTVLMLLHKSQDVCDEWIISPCHVTLMMHKALCNPKMSDMKFLRQTFTLGLDVDFNYIIQQLYLQTIVLTFCLIW